MVTINNVKKGKRFSNLSIIHFERDITNNIDSKDILNTFASDRDIPLCIKMIF